MKKNKLDLVRPLIYDLISRESDPARYMCVLYAKVSYMFPSVFTQVSIGVDI
jgi:hypothetical protein